MAKLDQRRTPFLDALKKYTAEDVVPFDVPGHHMGNIDNKATKLFGKKLYRYDVNAPIGTDNLAKPHGPLLQAERLLAEATGADEAFFLINGTSSGIIAMIMAAVKAGERIILPRNVHKSVINALILSGAIPEYVMPSIDGDLEIANQPSLKDFEKAILRHPSAKAVFVINPTYFGSVCDLKSLVEIAHAHNMAVLVDEAHGAHFYFHAKESPITAMDAGADISSVSFHKTAGSLTQSSVLLVKGKAFSRYDIQKALNITNTTSPSMILMASLDAARSFMATEGREAQEKTYELVRYAEAEINKIPGFYVASTEHFLKYGSFDFDPSKFVIGLDKLDIDGFHLYQLLKKEEGVQLELAETYAVLAIFAIGTKKEHVDRLIEGLRRISKEHYHPDISYEDHHFDSSFPYMLVRPRVAFHADGKLAKPEQCVGAISKEMVMIYPPGIPFICPGEVWTKELVDKLSFLKKTGATILSSYPNGFEIVDTAKWKKFPLYAKRLSDYRDSKKTTPSNDGFHMPFEGEKHKATVVLLPFRHDTWRQKGAPARKNFKEVIDAIAKHEPVIVGIHPAIYDEVIGDYRMRKNIEPIKIRYNDSWARDNMPLFVTDSKRIRGVDFRFNAWGGDFDGLYKNYQDDDRLSSVFDRKYKIRDYRLDSFVFEGGAIAVDGKGTGIVVEACLLSPGRNPTLRKEEIEEVLKEYLGLEKLIWIPHGIYGDETNEHVDNMVAFVKPGVLALSWCDDPSDQQYYYSHEAYRILAEEKDAKGHAFEIHKILVPHPNLTMTKEEAKGLSSAMREGAKPRLEGDRLSASYVNFYQGKGFVILPAFGVAEDKLAYEEFSRLFPRKKIHQINTREILLGGGNIHCITMQIPEVKK